MRLLSYAAGARTSIGVEVDGRVVDLPLGFAALPASAKSTAMAQPAAEMIAFLEQGEPALAAAQAVADYFAANGKGAPGDAVLAGNAVKVLAPVAAPRKIFCLGLNYRDHAMEGGMKLPEEPIIFSKMATAVIGPGEPVLLPWPEISNEIDYEAEFAFVIGKVAKHVAREQAMNYVAGYTIMNDVSARDIQFRESQWLRAKSFDTFAPMGPYLVTRDSLDPTDLDVKLWLNGQQMQSSNTKQLIFDVTYLVAHLSKSFTLLPGDVISTGTPGGVGVFRKPPVLLKDGDVVRIEIKGLGALENPMVQEPR